MHNDAVRRIMAEFRELSRLNAQPQRLFYAVPLESDLFEWHFSVRGPPDTAFEGGIYHGRIVLPTDYPLKPPEIIMLTPNGRFEVGKRICLSVTAHHQETWQPSWGIRTILTALIGFMPSPAEGLGSLDYPDDDRRRLARKSLAFKCDRCGVRPIEQLPPVMAILGTTEGNVLGSASSPNVQARSAAPEPPLAKGSSSGASSSAPSSDARTNEQSAKFAATASPASASPTVRSAHSQEATTSASGESQTAAASRSHATETSSPARRVRNSSRRGEEKELLYMAYAVVALMIAVIVRRVVKTMTE